MSNTRHQQADICCTKILPIRLQILATGEAVEIRNHKQSYIKKPPPII